EVELQLIAAEGIMALCEKARGGQLVEIAWLFAVVEDDLLIEIAQFVKHGAKIRKPKFETRNKFEWPISFWRLGKVWIRLQAFPNYFVQFFTERCITNALDDFAREGVNQHSACGFLAQPPRAQIKNRFVV